MCHWHARITTRTWSINQSETVDEFIFMSCQLSSMQRQWYNPLWYCMCHPHTQVLSRYPNQQNFLQTFSPSIRQLIFQCRDFSLNDSEGKVTVSSFPRLEWKNASSFIFSDFLTHIHTSVVKCSSIGEKGLCESRTFLSFSFLKTKKHIIRQHHEQNLRLLRQSIIGSFQAEFRSRLTRRNTVF